MEGIPSSVVIAPGQKDPPTHNHTMGGNSDSLAGAVHSRARPRRNDEPAPFLCVDNLPVDKIIIDGRSSAHAAPRKTMTTFHRDVVSEATPSSAPVKKPSIGVQVQSPSRVVSRSSMRNASSAASYNYNSFFTHKNPAFLSGPPTLWSMNNRFWPHATPPSEKPRLPPLPSALNLEIASQRPRNAQPFKHGSPQEAVQDRPVSPSFEMKIQTVNAIRSVSRKLSKESVPSTAAIDSSGRLLKGRLKPLQTFKVEGPPINKCQGIQPGTARSYAPSQSRLLQRKRELLNMLPPDVFQTRPQTEESVHRTSIASTWNETGGNEYESELQPKDPSNDQDLKTSFTKSKPCYQPPNSPTEQLGEPTIRKAHVEGDEDASYPRDTLTEGGASQILCKMISRVKTSPVKGDSTALDEADGQSIEGSIKNDTVGGGLPETKSEPDLTSGKVNLSDDNFAVNRQESDEQTGIGDDEISSLQGSEVFDVAMTEIVDARQVERGDLGSTQAVQSFVESEKMRVVLKARSSHIEEGELLETYSGTYQSEERRAFDVNGNLKEEGKEYEQGVKFFISESPSSGAVSQKSGALYQEYCGHGASPGCLEDGAQPVDFVVESDVHAGYAKVSGSNELAKSYENGHSGDTSPCRNSDRGCDIDRVCDDLVSSVNRNMFSSSEDDNELGGCHGDQVVIHHHCDRPENQLADGNVMSDGTRPEERSQQNDNKASNTVKPNAPNGSCRDDVNEIHHHGDRKDDDEEEDGTPGCKNQGGCSDAPRACTSPGDQDGTENTNNSNQGGPTDQSEDYPEDIPVIDESVLFCGHCGLDIDDCRCFFLKDPVLMAYQDILTKEGGVLQTAAEEVGQGSRERGRPEGRPHSAPCSLTEGMTVIRGTKLSAKNGCDDRRGRHGEEEQAPEENQNERLPVGDLSVVATTLRPRNSKSVEMTAPTPLHFKITGRPPDGMAYYFGYGTEMNSDRLLGYLGDEEIGQRLWGVLYGFTLNFNRRGVELSAGGFPNISYDPGSSVEGCVYCLTLDQLQKLDRMLGCPEFQIKVVLPVWMVNCCTPSDLGVAQCCVPAVIHIARDAWTHSGPLCNSYSLQQCMLGGDLLTPAYRSHLQSLMCACCR